MTRNGFLVIGASVALAYIAGRYSAPERVRVETKTEVKEVRVDDESRKLNQTQRVVETTYPDGRTVKDTRIKTKRESERTRQTESTSKVDQVKTIENRRGVAVSVLAGLPMTSLTSGPVYGASVSKQFLGPFIVGAWAFTDLRVGISIGMEL